MIEGAKIVPVDLKKEVQTSYIDYAMSVIVGRALPDIKDGLKPVHRRILYAMYEDGITFDKPHKKSATVVGSAMARYHPHGDAAIYDALVRLAQDFSTRYPLVDGHGNFGSVDGDPPAAMRYTEVRLAPIALKMLQDIEKETVETQPNFDDSLKEPVVLPSYFPNLLVNGSSGIAVGMATNIPPHNLTETIDALLLLIDNPEATVEDLMTKIKGPDFPTGGIILGMEGIKKAYTTGRGIIKVRGRVEIETKEKKNRLIIKELPYEVNKARLIENIAELVREKKIEGISELRDETDRTGMRVVIELKRDTNPEILLNKLYNHTQLENNFGAILLALVDGVPRILNLKEILSFYLDHQKDIVTKRTRYDLKKAEERAHIIEGLILALQHLDEVIKTIRQSRDVPSARKALMENFSFTERQAQAILEMRLQRLTALEREKLEEEYQNLLADIERFRAILANEELLLGVIREEFLEVKKRFGDERRTSITAEYEKLEIEDLIEDEEVVVTLTHQGYIKRISSSSYRLQRRGGRGIIAMGTKEKDFVKDLFVTHNHAHLLFFSNKGRMFRLKVYEVPEEARQSRGVPLVNLIRLEEKERISAIIPVDLFSDEQFLLMATKKGLVKKTNLIEYNTLRRDGIRAINLREDDELVGVCLLKGDENIILGTKKGKAICFNEKEVRPAGRVTMGVKGITLKEGDEVVAVEITTPSSKILTLTVNGFGKITPLADFRLQSRGGKGIIAHRINKRTGELVSLIALDNDEQDIMIITANGILIRLSPNEIRELKRATQGVYCIRLDKNDRVVAVAKVEKE